MSIHTTKPVVELKGISKSFSGVAALKNVSLRAMAGQCLGLLGENGAGKSTLMKVLSGVWPKGTFEGEIFVDGSKREFTMPREASEAGIAIIHQELSLFPEMSVAENVFIQDIPSSCGIIRKNELIVKAEEIFNRLGFKIQPEALVKTLSVGEKQLVEIARAFSKPIRVLILDEPTSALTDRETESLLALVKSLKKQGVACLYISHKLSEIREVCDQVCVLRDGQSVAHLESPPFTDETLIEAMVGRKIDSIFPPKRPADKTRSTILDVRNLHYEDQQTGRPLLNNISFDVRQGEIFGISGLMGSRRTELLLALFGALRAKKCSGEIFLNGKNFAPTSPTDAIRAGLALLTEDRKISGLVLPGSLQENMSLSILKKISQAFVIEKEKEEQIVDYYIKILRIKTPDALFPVRHLSGGNQQKVIIGRWLATEPKILLLDEPTRGIDVMAKAEIYFLMRKLVDQGLTLIMVSSELPEIVSLCDRVLVLREGHVGGILEDPDINQKRIMEKAVA